MIITVFSSKTAFSAVSSKYQPFLEPLDGEEADEQCKGADIKQIQQKVRRVLMHAYRADEADRMCQRNNLGDRPDVGGQI